ncbi:AMP-binding protein [Mycolicibacterium peregrinum]|uniref:AMP-binding protein n=2 Tax=Mycolicibacterium peregrinum TaxID=43304 RepID=A0A4Z0HPC9_MYCPR|nr:AMP-binding protein [Mycolicibacterium peregrinum]TGB41150.1 AMP-binding protein [Mycolicibacterium peregrinum]
MKRQNTRATTSSSTGRAEVPVLATLTGFDAVNRTFAQMLCDRAEREPNVIAYCSWGNGAAHPTTWNEYLEQVREAALGLHDVGAAPGDRVAIVSSTRHEWVVAALAILSLGGVPVGVYPTSSAAEVKQALESSEATVVFAENAADVAKVAAVSAELPRLRATIGFDTKPQGLSESVRAVHWGELRHRGRSRSVTEPELFATLVEAGDIDQPAALFYTSGSTGAPKGVIHTHRTLQYSVLAFAMSYPEVGRIRHDLVAFLGLSHVAPALIGVFTPIMTRLVITYCTMDQRLDALVGVRPTAVLWPPRMHEKLAGEVLQQLSDSGAAVRLRYAIAMQIARKVSEMRWRDQDVPWYFNYLYSVCLRRVFLPLRAEVGMDRIRVAWTASGSMSPEVTALWQMWGLDLRELFGTTETCGSVLAQWDRAFPPPGTIGKTMPDPQWKARVSGEGELQLRSPCLFSGYLDDSEATAAAMDHGWYRTGDLVEMGPDGEVRIIGRIKDVLKTSGGKTVSPQPIELRLKASPLIDEAIVVGEGRKYLTVLVGVSAEAWAMPTADRDAALATWIDEVNSELSRPLQLKKFRILPRLLSAVDGELTLKGTIRRSAILASFRDLVDEMYDAGEQGQIARQARFAGGDLK